ncbi:anaerobic ribonucleoside-triphosphate reductase [Helicobacter sp. 11S02629-2]|uniref:anaerobic ribonucleoside-triphosphate reductase n=1 Tax=Helicobacter sp. 11S02629-2 TaxID=1476195 RepID=UPI000BA7B725|nr:anaerobic ribonucleoside-triphosphate reductase [Helicobacter sp. 11S02629-2]PAF45982.1 anaerobic ribonucleoside-triphosphate reductase [Helicobacter sp. 11S02629-2]
MITLTKNQLDEKLRYAKSYIETTHNNSTLSEVDPNANVDKKTIATLGAEFFKDAAMQVNRYALGERIEVLFGTKSRQNYEDMLSSHLIYSHDESVLFARPYCVAIDLYPYIQKGNKCVGGLSEAPKHLSSFCGSYVNLIFMIAGRFAGAIADVSLLTYFDYFARKDFGDDYLKTHKEVIIGHFKQVIYTLNEPAGGRGYQAVFYNTSIFDKYYFEALFSHITLPDFSNPKWESVEKLQRFFMAWFNKERERAILTFPVITAAFITELDSKTKNLMPKDLDFLDFISEEMSRGNSFFIYSSDNADSLSSCCRLKNEITKDMKNTFAYTLGGTGISTGSIKVFTININRLVQKGYNLESIVKEVQKFLVAFRDLVEDNLKHGLLPDYDAGFISADKQYLTIGINGVVESAEFLGFEISNNEKYKAYLSGLFQKIASLNKKYSQIYTQKMGYKIRFNTEQTPCENLGAKNAKWDKNDNLFVPRDVYNSYNYVVESDALDIFEKFDLYGSGVTKHLDGGSAYHMNLCELPTKSVFKKLVLYSVKVGCNYWTFNVKATCCNNKECGYINKHTKDHCVKCGSKDIDYATRVIGYLVRVGSMSTERKQESKRRFYA